MGLAVLLFVASSHGAQPSKEVPAEEILQRIQAGQPVEYDNVTIVGDLNVSGLKLPTVHVGRTWLEKSDLHLTDDSKSIASVITVTNSLIRGSIDFKGATLQKEVNLSGTEILGEAHFSGARFNQSAYFFNSQFNQSVYFSFSRFNQFADFLDSRFNGSADFLDSQFDQSAQFSSWFRKSAIFMGSQFNQSVGFWYSRFNGSADFLGSQFDQSADFSYSRFNQGAEFTDSQFNQSADFEYSQFNGSANFLDLQFNGESHFEDVHFLYANFRDSRFSKEAFFDDSKINETLYFYRTKYDKLNIRWSSIHDLAYDDTSYYLLIENFKKQGFFDDANECYYSYRCKHGWELLRQGKIFNWFFDSLAWGTYGYGLQPWQPLGWSVCFIVLGGFFFWRSKGIIRKEDDSKDVSIWEAFLLSATYYTSGASAIISTTPMEFTPQGRARYVVVLLRLSGWIFFVLFLASLTRIV